MNVKYLLLILLLVGMALSGCVGDRSDESVSSTPQSTTQESGAPSEIDVPSDEFSELEFGDIESDLAELEALLGEIDNESDMLAEVDYSMLA